MKLREPWEFKEAQQCRVEQVVTYSAPGLPVCWIIASFRMDHKVIKNETGRLQICLCIGNMIAHITEVTFNMVKTPSSKGSYLTDFVVRLPLATVSTFKKELFLFYDASLLCFFYCWYTFCVVCLITHYHSSMQQFHSIWAGVGISAPCLLALFYVSSNLWGKCLALSIPSSPPSL